MNETTYRGFKFFQKLEPKENQIHLVTDALFVVGIALVSMIYFKFLPTIWIVAYVVLVGGPVAFYLLGHLFTRLVKKDSNLNMF